MAGFGDAEIHTCDSQSPGNKLKVRIEDEYQCTVPFDDTVVLKSPSVETRLENLDADTEILDISECVGDLRTQTTADIEKEVVLDSDDEEIHRTEVVSVMKGLSSDETKESIGGDVLDLEKRQLTPAAKQCYVGYLRRRSSTVGVQSVRDYCSARSSLTDKGNDSGPSSINADTHCQKHVMKDNDKLTVDRIVKEVDQVSESWECTDKMINFMGEIKSRDVVRNISTKEMFVEKKVSSSNCEAMDERKDSSHVSCDHELSMLSYIESQENGEPSQADAMDFVDHYLSVIDVNFSPEREIGKATGMKSPPAFSAKGPRSLARRANLISKVGETESFDWIDSQTDDGGDIFQRKRNELILDSKSHTRRSSMTQVAENLNLQTEKNLGVECKDKMKGTIMNSNHIDSRLLVHNSTEMVQTTKMKSDTNFIQELGKQFDAESLGQQLENHGIGMDVPGMSDVGFDTQMAAEAMEALLYASPPNSNASAHQGLENMLEDSPKGAIKRKPSKRCSFHKMADSGVIGRRSKRTKTPANKFCRNMSSSFQKLAKNQNELDLVLPVTKKVVMGKSETENYFNCRNPGNAKKSLHKKSSKIVTQLKEEGTPERENITDVDKNLSSSKSVNCNSLDKGRIGGEFRKFSPVAQRTRHSSSVHSLKWTEDPNFSSRERMNHDVMEVDVIKRRRRTSGLGNDVFQLDVRRKCPKLGSDTSGEATNRKVNQRGQADPDVAATTNHLKLNMWACPKGKRTRKNVSHHSKGISNICAPSTVADEEIGNGHCAKIHKKSEGNSKATCFSLNVDRKAWSTPQFWTSSEKNLEESLSRKISSEPSVGDVFNCKSSVMSGQMVHINSERANVNDKASLMYKGGENCKHPCSKNSSKSPLMKELTRLGFAESLPDFTSKDLRRKRNMANMCVLFSQSLDDDTIKQQRKISARLGISVASCCSDATHFITDRFVRSRNMLEAIALGKPVVTHLWLESCAQASCFIDEKNYILRDAKKEKKIGFSMPVSLARASHHPLLKGRRVFITPNVKPGKEMIESLVKAVHGQAMDKIQRAATKDKMVPDDILILSCEQDYAICGPFLEEGSAVYSSELLLDGIVTQKLEYERHELFRDHVKRNCSTRKGRDKQPLPIARR